MPDDCSSLDSPKLSRLAVSACSVPSLTFPTLKSPPKERKSSSVFNFLSALSLTPRGQEENTQQRVNPYSMFESCVSSQLSATHKHLGCPLCCGQTFLKTSPSDRLPLMIFLMCQHVCQRMLQVPALNLSSVGRESPTKSPSRALQPAEFDSNSGTALVFKQPKKVIPWSRHFCHIEILCRLFGLM